MNKNIIFDARVVTKPRVNKVGERTLVNVRIADNPMGQKNKDRYMTRFVDCCFSGFDVDRAKKLDKGDVITVVGELFHREYEKTGEGRGKKAKKEKGLAIDMPFAQLQLVVKGGTTAADDDDDEDADTDAETETPGLEDDPFEDSEDGEDGE